MGVYVKGMEMPKTGEYRCVIRKWQQGGTITIDLYGEEELSGTIVPIAPHGRLIDADELHTHLEEWYQTHKSAFSEREKLYLRAMLAGIADAPTIIPAEPFNNLSKPFKADKEAGE